MSSDIPSDSLSQAAAKPADSFAVVGIGASAGGLPALLEFFRHMPVDTGMAFVIVMPLDPEQHAQLAPAIARCTGMPTVQVQAEARQAIRPDQIFVIASGADLRLKEGHICLTPARLANGPQTSVDWFFRQLAMAYQRFAIGVVLSGADADGSLGIAAIKEHGGVTLAQVPDEARYDVMPRLAIASGMVDLVLPVARMPMRLQAVNLTLHRLDVAPLQSIEELANELDASQYIRALQDVLGLLRVRTGHDFKLYKGATVRRRIERRMQVNAIADLPTYHLFLRDNMAETQALLKDMLIGVTNFFRDSEAFAMLEHSVLPKLFDEQRLRDQDYEIRAWSAACSTGEEAYSLAMLMHEQADRSNLAVDVQIFATDIDEQALLAGRKGLYSPGILADVGAARVKQHFSMDGELLRIRKELRERVLFAKHNLLNDPPFSRLDLISCRNFLIYLDREAQAAVIQTFHFALRPGGYLFLGNSESAEVCATLFVAVDKRLRIYRARSTSKAVRAGTAMGSPDAVPRATLPTALEKTAGQKMSFADIHQRVLEHYAPPSAIIDQTGTIVHTSERVGRFFRYVGGEPTHHLLTLVQPELRLELRTAIFQASQSGKSVEARHVRLSRDGQPCHVKMIVRPFSDSNALSDYLLVLFDEVEDVLDARPLGDSEASSSVLSQLEAELQRTREQLQFTAEHSDTSTQELKASNEELQAINEELRSASEELETSKEELQSINEELITVNAELKAKIEESGKTNDDLQNLIASTDIGTVFVDRVMHIKWFTPQAAQIFNIIESDIGRSLLDITHRLDYPGLADDAMRVFESLHQIEREVHSRDERWFLARLLPYRTLDNRIEGAVLTFIDITERRQAQAQLRDGEAHRALVAQTVFAQDLTSSVLDGQFLGLVSNELLQPLQLIQANAESLAKVPEVQAVQSSLHAVAAIQRAADSQARSVTDLADLARLKAGQLTLARERLDLHQALLARLAAIAPGARTAGMGVRLGGTDHVSMWVRADPLRLEQVIGTLLEHAVMLTLPGGFVAVEWRHEGGFARLDIREEGTEDLPQPGDNAGLGSDLALALARQLVEAQGGRIGMASGGRTISVWLPADA